MILEINNAKKKKKKNSGKNHCTNFQQKNSGTKENIKEIATEIYNRKFFLLNIKN